MTSIPAHRTTVATRAGGEHTIEPGRAPAKGKRPPDADPAPEIHQSAPDRPATERTAR